MSNPTPPRGSRLIALVFAMVSLTIACWLFLVTRDGPNSAISVTKTDVFWSDGWRISVNSFGYHLYTRTVTSEAIVRAECAFWVCLPFAFISASTVVGWYFGRYISRPSAKPGSR